MFHQTVSVMYHLPLSYFALRFLSFSPFPYLFLQLYWFMLYMEQYKYILSFYTIGIMFCLLGFVMRYIKSCKYYFTTKQQQMVLMVLWSAGYNSWSNRASVRQLISCALKIHQFVSSAKDSEESECWAVRITAQFNYQIQDVLIKEIYVIWNWCFSYICYQSVLCVFLCFKSKIWKCVYSFKL